MKEENVFVCGDPRYQAPETLRALIAHLKGQKSEAELLDRALALEGGRFGWDFFHFFWFGGGGSFFFFFFLGGFRLIIFSCLWLGVHFLDEDLSVFRLSMVTFSCCFVLVMCSRRIHPSGDVFLSLRNLDSDDSLFFVFFEQL